MNALHKASFLLPGNDSKAAECKAFRLAEVFADNEMTERIDLFRILPNARSRSGGNISRSYNCEHVLGTLLDDIIDEYQQLDNLTTREVIEFILSYQSEQKWVLGQCDFNHRFSYKWEGDNLLSALFSVTQPFLEEYWWTWDTTVFPWVLNIIKPPDVVSAEARYGKNIIDVERKEDPTGIITRIYPKGYGEGVNQLTIESVNPTGKKYIDADPAIIAEYGLISDLWVDRRYEQAKTLFDAGQAQLKVASTPFLSYTVNAADLHLITKSPADKFTEASLIKVYDEELDIDVYQRVAKISKPDVKGDPGNISLEIANRKKDIATNINDLRERQRINEVYAQGATNIDTHDFNDNCDPDHPAVIRFYLPEETVHINKMILSLLVDNFRGYEKAIKGGGATASTTESGGQSTQTSSSGGASTQTSSSGGGVSKSTAAGGSSTQTSSSGGGVSKSTASGGSSTQTSSTKVFDTWVIDSSVPVGSSPTTSNHYHQVTMQGDWFTHSHNVSIPNHTHSFSTPDHSHTVAIPDHTHNVTIPDHTHTVSIPNHTHTVNIPAHKHDFSIPDHTHEILYGIFEGPQATSLTIAVDGQDLPDHSTNQSDVDILPYLSKDSEGKIERGVWHEITITPDDLSRITANVVSQFFIQSRGGSQM